MPGLEGLRERLVERFRQMCARTGMYVIGADAADTFCREIFEVLAYVDDCEQQYTQELVRCRRDDFGPTSAARMGSWFTPGVVQIEGYDLARYTGAGEVAAWYAELAARFGWLDVPRLSATDLAAVVTALSDPDGIDTWTRGRLLAELPAASIVVDRSIHCFAPSDPDARWVYVDVLRQFGSRWDRPETPVRSFRTGGPHGARSAMVVSTTGRLMLAVPDEPLPGARAARVAR